MLPARSRVRIVIAARGRSSSSQRGPPAEGRPFVVCAGPAAGVLLHQQAIMFHVDLDPDHPGFHDRCYRDRRDAIARIAEDYAGEGKIPEAPYTAAEHAVWRTVRAALAPLHRRFAAREVQVILDRFPLSAGSI